MIDAAYCIREMVRIREDRDTARAEVARLRKSRDAWRALALSAGQDAPTDTQPDSAPAVPADSDLGREYGV